MADWLSGISFAWPWMLLALPLPFIARYFLRPRPAGAQSALRLAFMDLAATTQVAARRAGMRLDFRLVLALLAWGLFTLALMRPQLLGEQQSAAMTGRNLMLAVDLSGSMNQEDFSLGGQRVDRLTATKAVAGDFIERRHGDRLGLILFGELAYLQTPLTFDHDTLRTLLFEAQIGLAGEKTAIGDAIALAVKRARDAQQSRQKQVLILITDGANTAGKIDPLKAAELAADSGLKIYSIGIGADRVRIDSPFGPREINPSIDLDEKTLTAIATQTGGRYFRARDTASLALIYRELDELEPAADEQDGYTPKDDVFHWPAAMAGFLFAAVALSRRGASL